MTEAQNEEYETTLEAVNEVEETTKTELAWSILAGREGNNCEQGNAITVLQERVNGEDSEAMWMLGICYEFGIGVEQSLEQAELLYHQSRRGSNRIGRFLVDNVKVSKKGTGYLRIKR